MDLQPAGLPGIKTERATAHRKVLLTDQGSVFIPKLRVIDGALSRDAGNGTDYDILRAGVVMGMHGTSSKFRPAIIGNTTAAGTAAGATLTVSVATATEIQRLMTALGTHLHALLVGPPTAGGTVAATAIQIDSVNLGTGVLTLSGALGVDKVTDSHITPVVAEGGTPKTLMWEGYGVKVTDELQASIDVGMDHILVGGVIDVNYVVNYPADASTKAWLKAQLRASAPALVFSDDF